MSGLGSLVNYFKDVKLEFSKVAWVPKKELMHLTITILLITIFVACSFVVVDSLVSSMIMKIIFM